MGKSTTISILTTQKEEITELIFEKDWLGYRRWQSWGFPLRNNVHYPRSLGNCQRNVAEFVRRAIANQLDRDKMQISSRKEKREDDFY